MTAPAMKAADPATLDDLLAIHDGDRRHELIDGTLVEKGAATGEHGAAQRKLSAFVDPYDQRPGGRWPGGWWLATEVDIYFDAANPKAKTEPKRSPTAYKVWTGRSWSDAATEAMKFPTLDAADDYVRHHYIDIMKRTDP